MPEPMVRHSGIQNANQEAPHVAVARGPQLAAIGHHEPLLGSKADRMGHYSALLTKYTSPSVSPRLSTSSVPAVTPVTNATYAFTSGSRRAGSMGCWSSLYERRTIDRNSSGVFVGGSGTPSVAPDGAAVVRVVVGAG